MIAISFFIFIHLLSLCEYRQRVYRNVMNRMNNAPPC